MDVLESRKGLRKLNEGLGDWGGEGSAQSTETL